MVIRYPEALEEFSESFQIFIKMIVNKCDRGGNIKLGIYGQTGSGKSLDAVQIKRAVYLYMYGKEPEPEYLINRVYFKAKPFVEAMQKLSDNLHEKGRTKTMVHLWDEVGYGAGHKTHASVNNRVLGWLFQTFRNLKQIIIVTTPSISFIDASIRKLMDYYVETIGIDRQKKISIVKPLSVQYNVRMDKTYYHNLKCPTKDGIVEVDIMSIPKVSDELENLYDEKKNKFTKDLNDEIVQTLNQLQMKERTSADRLTDRQKRIIEILKGGETSTNKIAGIIGVKATTISKNFQFMRNKGIDIDKLLKKTPFSTINTKSETQST